MEETLYVLIPCGVSEQAAAGVYRSREAAQEAAEALWARSDGYHGFEIREMVVGTTYDSFSRGWRPESTWRTCPPDKPLGRLDLVNPKVFDPEED